MMVTDEARRLFAVVVNELWDKHPELVVPGWINWEWDGDDLWLKRSHMTRTKVTDTDILAGAALCAEQMAENKVFACKDERGRFRRFVMEDTMAVCGLSCHMRQTCWPSAQFAAILAEKGIEHE